MRRHLFWNTTFACDAPFPVRQKLMAAKGGAVDELPGQHLEHLFVSLGAKLGSSDGRGGERH